jgi:hypothetical protein
MLETGVDRQLLVAFYDTEILLPHIEYDGILRNSVLTGWGRKWHLKHYLGIRLEELGKPRRSSAHIISAGSQPTLCQEVLSQCYTCRSSASVIPAGPQLIYTRMS